jgi:hypothetical protein
LLRILCSSPGSHASLSNQTPDTSEMSLPLPHGSSIYRPIQDSWEKITLNAPFELENSMYVLNQKVLFEKHIRLHGYEAFQPPFPEDTGLLFFRVVSLNAFKDSGGMFVVRSSEFRNQKIKLKGSQPKQLPSSEFCLPEVAVNVSSLEPAMQASGANQESNLSIAALNAFNIEDVQDLLSNLGTNIRGNHAPTTPPGAKSDFIEPLTPDSGLNESSGLYSQNNVSLIVSFFLFVFKY